ncbi:hypothetical protein PT2222_80158 [Paraburkholderia tropica]
MPYQHRAAARDISRRRVSRRRGAHRPIRPARPIYPIASEHVPPSLPPVRAGLRPGARLRAARPNRRRRTRAGLLHGCKPRRAAELSDQRERGCERDCARGQLSARRAVSGLAIRSAGHAVGVGGAVRFAAIVAGILDGDVLTVRRRRRACRDPRLIRPHPLKNRSSP